MKYVNLKRIKKYEMSSMFLCAKNWYTQVFVSCKSSQRLEVSGSLSEDTFNNFKINTLN